MTTNLGTKIKQLRKNRNISQEVLAQYLGVSFQAVSKWETNSAMPDVSLIPAIASFFDVSIDELFDYNRLVAEEKVTALCREAAEYRVNDPEKAERMLQEGLKQYPGNEIILNNLLYTMDPETRSEEMITTCKALIESAQDDTVKYDAARILAETYHRTGQQALVESTLEIIPEVYFTKLEQMAFLLEGDQSLNAATAQMEISLEQVLDMLMIMENRYRGSGRRDDAERAKALSQAISRAFTQIDGREIRIVDGYPTIRQW